MLMVGDPCLTHCRKLLDETEANAPLAPHVTEAIAEAERARARIFWKELATIPQELLMRGRVFPTDTETA
jgi:hypothetical protein